MTVRRASDDQAQEVRRLGVSDSADLVRRRELSAVDLVEAALRQVEALDPELQAWETVDPERAIAAARACDRLVAAGKAGPLSGVPIGVKDIYCTADLPTTAGFPHWQTFIPRVDAAAVARLRGAGAIILGKTVTTQFAFGDPPVTRNPWNRDRTPGGSSSGSAAAVAARMVPAALGTQTAGSVLRPSAYCGVVGFKPSFGCISRYGIVPLSWSLDHAGVIVRSVEDAARLFAVLAGYDARDEGSTRRSIRARGKVEAAPRFLAVEDVGKRTDPEVWARFEAVARRLADAGARIQFARLPVDLATLLAVHHLTMQVEAAAAHADLFARHPEGYRPRVRALIEVGQLVPAAAYARAQRLRRQLQAAIDRWLSGADGIILPTASSVAPDRSTTGDMSFQAPWTLLGLPAVSLPTGLSGDGLPLALQVVGRRFDDVRLLGIARWCEERLDPMPAPIGH